MILAYALPKTGHPNCRRPDKVIDAGQEKKKNQMLLGKLRSTNHQDVITILPLIDKYGCVVEHEILLASLS